MRPKKIYDLDTLKRYNTFSLDYFKIVHRNIFTFRNLNEDIHPLSDMEYDINNNSILNIDEKRFYYKNRNSISGLANHHILMHFNDMLYLEDFYDDYDDYNCETISMFDIKNRKVVENKLNTSGKIISNITNIIDKGEMMILNHIKNSLKDYFGKEYLFTYSSDYYIINEITNKFIRKYDKKFKKHISINLNNKYNIKNKQFIITLNDNTYIYIASGKNINNIEDRFLMYNNISDIDLYIYIFGKRYKKYVKELNTLIKKLNNNEQLGIYMIDVEKYNDSDRKSKSESIDVIFSDMQPRFLDTLFFSYGEKDQVCNHIDKFNRNKEFYLQRQLLYKTGILLYGEPGTGKSSFVKAIATNYNRSIISINMSNIKYIDLNKLTQSINIDNMKSFIVLLEDIDTLFLNRSDSEVNREDQCVINKLLQFLDSNTSPTNVIFIATTNHIDRLDEALLREGRFDLKVEIKSLDKKGAILFGMSFGLEKDVIESIISDLDKEFPNNTGYNQSKLQTRILGKIENRSNEDSEKLHGEVGI